MRINRFASVALLPVTAFSAPLPSLRDAVQAVSASADAYFRLAPLVVGVESLTQTRWRPAPPPKRKLRVGRPPTVPPATRRVAQTRRIFSYYGCSTLTEVPRFLHEFREIVSVNEKPVTAPDKARRSLIEAVASEDDARKQELVDAYLDRGLAGAPNDFALLLLLFAGAQSSTYVFTLEGEEALGSVPAVRLSYMQTEGSQALTFSEGEGKEPKKPITGSIWLRQPDLMPVRVALGVSWPERSRKNEPPGETRIEAEVDYFASPLGGPLPLRMVQRQLASGVVVKENAATYSNFEQFAQR